MIFPTIHLSNYPSFCHGHQFPQNLDLLRKGPQSPSINESLGRGLWRINWTEQVSKKKDLRRETKRHWIKIWSTDSWLFQKEEAKLLYAIDFPKSLVPALKKELEEHEESSGRKIPQRIPPSDLFIFFPAEKENIKNIYYLEASLGK